MKRRLLFEDSARLVGFAVAVFVAFGSFAEEGIGTFNGAGGVMRDAERRALDAQMPKGDAKVPALKAPDKKDGQADAAKAGTLGVIEEIVIFGAREFAERVSLADRIAEHVCDGTAKTDKQVNEALAVVRNELLNEGYYLVRFFSIPKPYDAAKKTYSIKVDDGRFGKRNVRFDTKDRGKKDETATEPSKAGEQDAADGAWFSRSQIMRRFRLIQENDTFDYSRLRSALFDANSHPDLTIDTKINVNRKSEGEGNDRRFVRYADLDLLVHEKFPLHGVLEVNNYGMEEIEEWQTSLTLQYLNLSKRDDVLTLSPSISLNGELMSLAGSYLLPHAWWLGGNTTLYGGWSYLDTDDVVPRLDLEGLGWFVGLQHSENLVDTRKHLVFASAGVLWRYIEDQYSAYGKKLNQRDVSVMPLSLAISYTQRTPDALGGRNFATVQGVFNPFSSGDDLDKMWTNADDPYSILRWQIARLQPLFGMYDETTRKDLHQWTLFAKLEGQYSPDVLIPTEKLSLGGYNTVRGYHTRGYMGDNGVYGTFELRTPILVDSIASLVSSRKGKTPFDRLQALVFTDFGYTFYNDLPAGYDDDEWLWSIGAGLRAAMTKYCQARLDFGVPLHDISGSDDDDFELYLSVQFQY
ncbi:MAG: ShlB/FhaC/HecB family hemolysin secretion/activation protein [Kiritimatiellae bacterium]|nr:ShlB/FhaC/HecB family hemolysin secretion/activation protein [Kiritimatiellia bacterium]